jgi:hypothetical protein
VNNARWEDVMNIERFRRVANAWGGENEVASLRSVCGASDGKNV